MTKQTRSITITQFDYIIRNLTDDELDIHGHANQYTEFDQDGHIIKEIKYMQDGSFEEMTTYEYDQSGRIVCESCYPTEDELAEQMFFRYGDSGEIVQATKRYQDGSEDLINYEYDAAGLLTRKVTINEDNDVEQTDNYLYEDGRLVGRDIFDGEGNMISEPFTDLAPANTKIERNEAGKVISEEELDENGDVIMSVTRTYLPSGEPDEIEVYLDGQGKRISRHYLLKYEYSFFD